MCRIKDFLWLNAEGRKDLCKVTIYNSGRFAHSHRSWIFADAISLDLARLWSMRHLQEARTICCLIIISARHFQLYFPPNSVQNNPQHIIDWWLNSYGIFRKSWITFKLSADLHIVGSLRNFAFSQWNANKITICARAREREMLENVKCNANTHIKTSKRHTHTHQRHHALLITLIKRHATQEFNRYVVYNTKPDEDLV